MERQVWETRSSWDRPSNGARESQGTITREQVSCSGRGDASREQVKANPPVELVSGGKSQSNTVMLSKHLDGGGVREAQEQYHC